MGSGDGWRAGKWAGKKPFILLRGDGGIMVDGSLLGIRSEGWGYTHLEKWRTPSPALGELRKGEAGLPDACMPCPAL